MFIKKFSYLKFQALCPRESDEYLQMEQLPNFDMLITYKPAWNDMSLKQVKDEFNRQVRKSRIHGKRKLCTKEGFQHEV